MGGTLCCCAQDSADVNADADVEDEDDWQC